MLGKIQFLNKKGGYEVEVSSCIIDVFPWCFTEVDSHCVFPEARPLEEQVTFGESIIRTQWTVMGHLNS